MLEQFAASRKGFGLMINSSDPISMFRNSSVTFDFDFMIDELEMDEDSKDEFAQDLESMRLIKAYFPANQTVKAFSDMTSYQDPKADAQFKSFIEFCFQHLSPSLSKELTVKDGAEVFTMEVYPDLLIAKPDNGSDATLLIWSE